LLLPSPREGRNPPPPAPQREASGKKHQGREDDKGELAEHFSSIQYQEQQHLYSPEGLMEVIMENIVIASLCFAIWLLSKQGGPI